jgi:hypothetical protein
MSDGEPGRNGNVPPDLSMKLAGLLPGDIVQLRDLTTRVETVLACRETVADALTSWRWIWLDGHILIETAPRGRYCYREHEVLTRGSAACEELVAQDGALVRFEQRVRERVVDDRPVRVTLQGREYRIAATGTVEARRFGAEPALPPWRTFQAQPQDNVYFILHGTSDPADVVLGLWTADVCLSFGRALQTDDVLSVLPSAEPRSNGPVDEPSA